MIIKRKPDMMIMLVIVVALGVITTTAVQANETEEISQLIGMRKCVRMVGQEKACIDLEEMLSYGSSETLLLKGSNPASFSGMKSTNRAGVQEDQYMASVAFVPQHEGVCDDLAIFNGQQSGVSDEITEMRVDFNQNLGVDVGLGGANISSVYLELKDCW